MIYLIPLAAWLVLGVAVAVAMGKGIHLADNELEPEDVRWMPTLPPVPPTRSELAWLASQPADVLADGSIEMAWKFDAVVREGWAA